MDQVVSAHPRVLVLTAELSRSGVPVVLERYLRSVGPTAARGVSVLTGRDGPLSGPLEATGASVIACGPPAGRSPVWTVAAGLEEAGAARVARVVRRADVRRRLAGGPAPDVVLVHGAGGLPLWELLRPDAPVVVHLHELDTGLARSAPPAVLGAALRAARRVLVVSGPVAASAVRAGAPADRVEVLPGVPDPALPADRDAARARLDPDGARRSLVGGAGQPGWRKGTDRLAALAHELGRHPRPTAVHWVGGPPSGAQAPWLGTPDPVHWWPERPDPWTLLAGLDVVVVPSREDPLPLVALEAGAHALPVVGTASGGMSDLLGGGRGRVVPAHDVPALVAAVAGLLERPEAAAAAGAALADHVAAHHDPTLVAGRWWELLVAAAG